MGDYAPPFTITNKILTYVSSISEKIGRITATSSHESKPHLRRKRIVTAIGNLPYGEDIKRLQGYENVLRLRVGSGKEEREWSGCFYQL